MAIASPLLASSCGLGWHDQQLGSVDVGDDGRTLFVGWHCEDDATVEAEELPDEVRLTFRVDGQSGNDCARSEQVRLAAPLGDRRLVDGSNGKEIVPCRPEAEPTGACG